jgi:hypothetical protein
MSSYPLQLSEELMAEVRRLAEENQTPIDQWLRVAIAERVEAERGLRLLKSYAEKSDYDRFDQILARVPDVKPIGGDELS